MASLPQPLAAKIKSIPMDPLALANNVELAYMLSFSNYVLSSDSVQCSPKDSYNSPLECYNFVDFDENTYETLYAETKKNYESKNSTVVKCIRNSFKDFFTRVSAMTYSAALKKDELLSAPSTSALKIPTFEAQYRIDQMRGNNPNEWPRNLKQFHQEISKLPWNAFSCETEIYFDDFFKNAFSTLRNFIKKLTGAENRTEIVKDIKLVIEVIVMISFKTNNQTYILTQLQSVRNLQLDKVLTEVQNYQLTSKLQVNCLDLLEKVPVNQEQEYHAPKKLWEKGSAFMIMKKIHFQKQNGLAYFTITNDGTYLYIYVSSINGGMFKVGTGKNSSIAGKIYLQKEILLPVGTKLDEVNWVYCQGKLYLKSGSRDPNSIEVINPDTFKTEQIIQLKCPSIFGHQSLVNLNRNSILLTDGHRLYYLGKQLKIKQSKDDKKQEQSKVPPAEEQGGKKKKMKKPKVQQNPSQAQKSNPEQIEKVLQFVLFQFEFDDKEKQIDCDEALADELYMSFNNYFTKTECRRALDLSDNDLSDAAQWLCQQGEKQRTTKTLYPSNKTIIAESQITSNFAEKSLKGSNQIITKQGSILHTQNVHESVWTMDEEEITCYSEGGFKIFSKSAVDAHPVNENSGLMTTHLKTLEGKIQRNPDYTISYDPYNRIFYTFTWPTDGGHYFPTAVLIGSDYKQALEINYQKKISLSQFDPRNIQQFSKWILIRINLLDNTHCPEHGRVNNWLWYLGQKIIELNKDINGTNDLDKKKLTNKRSKLINKMNRINQHFSIYQKNKQEFDQTGKITQEIRLIPPFGSDGTCENLIKIRNIFGKQLNYEQINNFVICLEGWLSSRPKILDTKTRQTLYQIRQELFKLKPKMNQTSVKKLNNLFIHNFFEFFENSTQQLEFITTLDKTQVSLFVEKHHFCRYRTRKSIVYELKTKQCLVQKYESKTKFEEIFLSVSNVSLKELYESFTLGNLMTDSENSDKKKDRSQFHKFLQREIINGPNGIKFFEFIFLEAFRSIVKRKKIEEYSKQLEKLFLDTFKIIEIVVPQANVALLKKLSDPLNQILQIYFASLCSFTPSVGLIQCLLKILDELQKKEIVQLFSCIEDLQFEGISQTFEKIYETPHPIERGKNQNFPPLKNTEASLIYAEFDKRCQSDPNHDNLAIQMIHENSPVGNSINCNDGVFTTNLRLTGKVDSGKPYLIMGNSVSVDFSSSGHAKDAKSFGRFGFKFGLRPIFAGKLKYKKQGINKVQKVFGTKSEFEKFLITLKLLTITVSNSIQSLVNFEKEDKDNQEVHRFLNGKIFKQGYEQEQNVIKNDNEPSQHNLEHFFGQKSKFRQDSRVLLMKILHAQSLKKDPKSQIKQQNLSSIKVDEKQIWQLDGIPGYIKSYVEKIKTFNGDFIDVFLETRNLALPKGIYATELKKAGFTQDMKNLWLQGEAILFLTVLKHSGLLHLNIKFSIQYIKANLKAFQQARNGIYESFIRRMQSVREWRDLLETFEGKRDQIVEQEQKSEKISENPKLTEKISGIQIKKKGMATKTIKLQNKGKNQPKAEKKVQKKVQQDQNVLAEKRRKQAQRMIRQRLTEEYMIKSICFIKGIEFVPKETYENVTRIIARLEQQSKSNKKQTQSVYIEPMQHLIRSCIFLLKLKSPSTKQIICEEENLEPEEMFRSYSQDQRHVNLNKVNVFREWLQNWKKWKDFKKEGKVQLKFPVSEIIDFVNSWIPLHRFKSQIHLRIRIAQNRTKFYELNNSLLKSTANSFLSKYAIGSEVACIKGSYNTGLESVSTTKMNELYQKYKQYSSSLKLEEEKKFKQLPLRLKQIQALIKTQSDNALQKIKLTSLHLYLIQSQNSNIDLDVALFFIPLKYLSSSHQELIFIASLIVQRGYLSNHSLDDVIDRLYKEVGNNSISCKRWKDLFFIERLLFLLRKLEHKCRQRLEVSEKQKVAEILFYIIYHLQIPLICRISLRILSLLKITLKRDIKTPFEKTYKAFTIGQNLSIQEFKLENKSEYNNLQLIAAKCFEVFKGQFKNEIKQKMLSTFKEIANDQSQKPDSYTIILNMNQEQDIVWMTSVLYYLEEIEKTMTPIKDWEEYLGKKNKKKQHHKEKQANNNKQGSNQEIQVNEKKPIKKVIEQRILLDIPNEQFGVNDQIQADLPVGWFFNYCNIFNDYTSKNASPVALNVQSAPNLAQKKGKNANQAINPTTTRKQWNPVEFLKLYKKFEDLTSKPLQQPKEDEPEENRVEFIKAKNFISRIRKHTGQVSTIFSNLSQNGYYVFRQDVPRQKCELICQLFTLGGQNRLKPLPCDFKTKDYPTKLSPAFAISPKKSELKITCIKSDQYKRFNDIINAPTGIQTKVENNPLLYYTSLSSSEFLLQDKCHLPYEQIPEVDSNEDDIKIQFSKYFTESGFSRMKKRQDQVYLKQYPKLRYFLSQGGLESGLQQCTLVPAFDSTLTCQKSTYDHIYPSVPKHEILQDSEELLEKIIKLMKGQFCEIKKKDHIIPYMLLSFYLEKLSVVNLQFVSVDLLKQFEDGLSKLIRGFKADSSIEKYRQRIQVLTTKMLDSENKNLSQFRLYRYDDDETNQNLVPFIDLDKIKSTLKPDQAQSTQETIETHQYPKSNYLLPVHTPIPEENKLLKYWEKNILPKIYDFVKSSLKQIQIDDFFEQMRIPLRKGDQLEAKKIAYVICDNKLPAGAVLPDSNHNWNSLTIEDVTVGQDVLLRLSRSKSESFSPIMCSQSQQHRVGQVMFIDQKNFSALVRHRLPEYAIFVYSWVPINSLQSVEESLAHYSLQTIYKQLESSLKGIIYNYSKICMTSLSKKVKINMESLLEETIVDIFRDNPISGWNENKSWPLKEVFKSQLAEGNTHVVSFVENKFAPVKSYDIDLFSESILNLNRFQNSLGLIVSFKKTASLIWYSGIRFYSDEYGFKQIANTYASKSCVNQLLPLQFKSPNVYCKYYTNKQFLKAFDQGKYQQKQIGATIFAVNSSWTVATYICNVVGQIAIEENKYEDYLCRFNKVFLKYLQKRQAIYLSNQLCRVITKNTLRIRRILGNKQKHVTMEAMGTSEEQIKSLLDWINILKEAEDKDVLVLYSPLLQNLIETIASLLSGFDKIPIIVPPYVQEFIKMIQMTTEIENNLEGKRNKKYPTNNDTQWERILVIENIPEYTSEKELRQKIKSILTKNNGKVLSPSFDIFYSENQLVILVDSWDITELVEEEVMQKIENEEQKEPEPENGDQGLLMEWACEVCTFFNQAGVSNCGMCDAAAPAPKTEIVYEKVQTKDVNETEIKLRQKEMKRFENIKQEIKAYINESWKSQCLKIDSLKQKQQKAKQQRRKKKGKNIETEQKVFVKPAQPQILLSSGSTVLDKKIVEQFLKKRYEKLPELITKKLNNEQLTTYLSKFKELTKLGYDLWGDNIANEAPSLLSFEYLSELMQYVQDEICKGSSSVLSYNQTSIRMINQIPLLRDDQEEPLNFNAQNNIGVKTKYKRLAEQKSYNIRYSWKVIKQLNLSASKCLPFINMRLIPHEQGKAICSINTIGSNLKCLRQLIMGTLKLQLFQKIMQRTSVVLEGQDIPKINLQRLKVKDESSRGSKLISAKDKDDFLFTKSHQQLDKVSSINLRPFKPKGTEPYLSFIINFKGELVQGEAGPYRQFFTDISNELSPEAGLNLFIKTPNNAHKTGEGRSKWTINPKANSTYNLSLFFFLGRLMGSCIRTGCHMPIDLANFCWKLIADEKVKQSDIDELDRQFYQQNKQLIQCPSESTFDYMQEAVGEPVSWVYTTIDGQEQDLIPNGKSERVSFQDRIKYVEMMEKRRIQEISLQVQKIREGLNQMISEPYLNHISGEELKTIICGVPKVDVQLLRKHTKYAGGLNEQSPVIKYFWEMMKEVTEQERLKVIRFCWGQERLPLNSEEFERNGVRFMIKPMLNKQNPDQALPKADTCFFNIELPQYSTKQILKQRILLAVNLDNVSINGDRNIQPDDNPLMGNVDYEDEGDEEDDEEGGGGGG